MERLAGLAGESPLMAIAVAVVLGILSTGACQFTLPAGVGMVGYVGTSAAGAGRNRLRNLAVALLFYSAVLLSFAVLGVVAAYVGQFLSR